MLPSSSRPSSRAWRSSRGERSREDTVMTRLGTVGHGAGDGKGRGERLLRVEDQLLAHQPQRRGVRSARGPGPGSGPFRRARRPPRRQPASAASGRGRQPFTTGSRGGAEDDEAVRQGREAEGVYSASAVVVVVGVDQRLDAAGRRHPTEAVDDERRPPTLARWRRDGRRVAGCSRSAPLARARRNRPVPARVGDGAKAMPRRGPAASTIAARSRCHASPKAAASSRAAAPIGAGARRTFLAGRAGGRSSSRRSSTSCSRPRTPLRGTGAGPAWRAAVLTRA